MKYYINKIMKLFFAILLVTNITLASDKEGNTNERINVVTTLTTYYDIVKFIGGDKVSVSYIVQGNQDAHFVRPKPSYAVLLNEADLFISTGLDLELWVPTLVDMSKNEKIRSGQVGFVSASDGVNLLDKPEVLSRSEGGLHIYGNPHFFTNPLNLKVVAENIYYGLKNVDSKNSDIYKKRLDEFQNKINEKAFGNKLIEIMGSRLLTKLANNGTLIEFLESKEYDGIKLIEHLDGWLKQTVELRGKKIVSYHKNWVYVEKLFGVEIVGHVEPKPGIPPSPKHVEELITKMKKDNVKMILAANYFDINKVNSICDKVGAVPVIVPMYVDEANGIKNVFEVTDLLLAKLIEASKKAN